ncbi:hypothetical protein [Bathymodiolus septemdierum thioautotrophic gill symbiont]|uniref:hypothetical protein n=1 Tax=Bathymodiolus septemdierum thioautotrophic gill symbiont TaxID=113267 RepID=UPI00138F523D|nr:hypothetical protein [Bathymodiolus septemdierum thioautotrophic gill symbiont]
MKKLVEVGKIQKIGSAPKVFYATISRDMTHLDYQLDTETQEIVDKNFFFIEPTGVELSGIDGFEKWCGKRDFDVTQKAKEFNKIHQKYQKQKHNDLLDASVKMRKTFGVGCCVDRLFYFDFYAVEIFGKTRMGQKLLHAKQGQNKAKIKEIAILVKSSIVEIIVHHHIDSVVFVPPTVPRAVQFMKVLETELALSIAKVNVIKVIGDIRVPQKTLKKLADRVENAQHTFMVDNMAKFKTTLIIDDAVGSGASINQIACKLKHAKHTNKVIGFAITGSLHDFEVISEV